MSAFGIQTTDDSARPNLEVFESIIGTRGPKHVARMGWSNRDELDLRRLSSAREKGVWKTAWNDPWDCHPFYDKVKNEDLLFYRNLPAKGRFTLVKITGDYSYLKKGGETNDFRSFRPCKVIFENVSLSDPAVGKALRTYLQLPRRIYEIPNELAEKFCEKKGAAKSSGSRVGSGSEERGRGPAELSSMKKKFSYVIGKHERTVNKEHLAYQIRLKKFLESKGLTPKFEDEYIDVEFSVGSDSFMGEVKVTNWLSVAEAFRIALGQILDYACTRRTDGFGLIIFLDTELDNPRRLKLASGLRVSVVVEQKKGEFVLQNRGVSKKLEELFLGT